MWNGVRLLLVVVMSCAALLSTAAAAPPRPSYPIAVTNGYKLPELLDAAFPSLATVLSPPSLAGQFAWASAPYTGPMFINRSCIADSGCTLTFRMSLLNARDNPFGCNVTHRTNSGGEAIDQRTMLLVERSPPGTCNFGTKAAIIAAIGAGALMHAGCDPSPPRSCAPGLAITLASGNITIPTTYLQFADAARWRAYLQGRDAWLIAQAAGQPLPPGDFSEPLIVSFAATGPMVPAERAALATIVHNLDSVDDSSYVPGMTALRGWRPLGVDPAVDPLDPCIDRVVGMWCEDGHLVSVYLPGAGDAPVFTGTFDPLWGSFAQLRGLEMSQHNFRGDLPPSLCQLSKLSALGFDRQSDRKRPEVRQGISALPECIGDIPALIFLSASTNLIRSVPFSLRSALDAGDDRRAGPRPGLRSLILDSNLIEGLPANFSRALQGVTILHLGSNPAVGGGVRPLPSFEGWARLSKLQLRTCGFAGDVPAGALDSLANLTLLDLGFNALTGSLPALVGAAVVDSIDLSHNNFTGGVPATWAKLATATSVTLAWNALSYPVESLGSMVSLRTLDLSHNALAVPPASAGEFADNVGAVVAAMVNNQLESLNIDHNRLRGNWSLGYLGGARALKSVSMAHNGLEEMPPDLFNMFAAEWDFSHNALRGPMPASTPVLVTSLLLTGNPHLALHPLPAWLSLSDDGDMVSQLGSLYSCRRLVYPALKNFRIEVDAQARGFVGCACARGSFGRAPLCQAVPEVAVVSPNAGFSSAEVGDDFARMINSSVADGRGVAAAVNGGVALLLSVQCQIVHKNLP